MPLATTASNMIPLCAVKFQVANKPLAMMLFLSFARAAFQGAPIPPVIEHGSGAHRQVKR
jgi:hypothetical protein